MLTVVKVYVTRVWRYLSLPGHYEPHYMSEIIPPPCHICHQSRLSFWEGRGVTPPEERADPFAAAASALSLEELLFVFADCCGTCHRTERSRYVKVYQTISFPYRAKNGGHAANVLIYLLIYFGSEWKWFGHFLAVLGCGHLDRCCVPKKSRNHKQPVFSDVARKVWRTGHPKMTLSKKTVCEGLELWLTIAHHPYAIVRRTLDWQRVGPNILKSTIILSWLREITP